MEQASADAGTWWCNAACWPVKVAWAWVQYTVYQSVADFYFLDGGILLPEKHVLF